jgi:amino acid permease
LCLAIIITTIFSSYFKDRTNAWEKKLFLSIIFITIIIIIFIYLSICFKHQEICKGRALQLVNIKGAEEQGNIIKLIRDSKLKIFKTKQKQKNKQLFIHR